MFPVLIPLIFSAFQLFFFQSFWALGQRGLGNFTFPTFVGFRAQSARIIPARVQGGWGHCCQNIYLIQSKQTFRKWWQKWFKINSDKDLSGSRSLASPKIAIAEKSLRFQIAKWKIVALLGRGIKIEAFSRFQNRSVFGTLRTETGTLERKSKWGCSDDSDLGNWNTNSQTNRSNNDQSSYPAEVRSENSLRFSLPKVSWYFGVKFAECYIYQGLNVRIGKCHKTPRQKRCEQRKVLRKFHSAGAWRWEFCCGNMMPRIVFSVGNPSDHNGRSRQFF